MLLVYVGTKSLVLCSQVPRQIRQISDESLFVLQQHLSKLTENISGDLKVVLPENDRSSLEEAQGLQIRTLSPCSVVAKKKKKSIWHKVNAGILAVFISIFCRLFFITRIVYPQFSGQCCGRASQMGWLRTGTWFCARGDFAVSGPYGPVLILRHLTIQHRHGKFKSEVCRARK